jgi:hypothetical protein
VEEFGWFATLSDSDRHRSPWQPYLIFRAFVSATKILLEGIRVVQVNFGEKKWRFRLNLALARENRQFCVFGPWQNLYLLIFAQNPAHFVCELAHFGLFVRARTFFCATSHILVWLCGFAHFSMVVRIRTF